MDLGLKGKVAIVTGGSRGLGRAIARSLAEEGARIVVVSRSEEALAKTVAELCETTEAIAVPADTGDESSVRSCVARAMRTLGSIDILVNAAAEPLAPGGGPSVSGIDATVLWPQVNVKVLGYLRMIREVVPHMRSQGGGRVVNVAGLSARTTGSTIGSIRNAAVAALTKTLADELAPDGISLVAVHPGLTVTEATLGLLESMADQLGIASDDAEARVVGATLLGRLVRAEEVADVVTFLASPRSLAVSGDAIPVGGGTRGPIFY